jgi:hypothetical protein
MQRFTICFVIFNALHVSGGFSAHHQEFKPVHTASGTYQMLCVQFLSSWLWAEKPPETCRALKITKNIVKFYILLVVPKKNRPYLVSWTATTQCFYRHHEISVFISPSPRNRVGTDKICWDHNHGQADFLTRHSSRDPFSLIMRVQ